MNKLSNYKMPSVSLLKDYSDERVGMRAEEHIRKVEILRKVLEENKVSFEKDIQAFFGPAVSEYNVVPAPGTKASIIKELADDIAFAMGVVAVRVSTRQYSVAIEIPNDHRSIVSLKGLVCDKVFRKNQAVLPLVIGYTMSQEIKLIDLFDAPHILLAGATKQGKTACLHTMVASLLFSKRPDELKMVFIDPKGAEFRAYQGLFNHYLAVRPDAASDEEHMDSIVTKAPAAADVLESLRAEMEERQEKLLKAKALNFKEYRGTDMPYIVCFVDEFADLTVHIGDKEFKALTRRIMNAIIRLAQKGHSVGIHLVLATRKPSTDVITGLIKANFPTRIAFKTSSRIDSTIILDMPGAEKLIGEGDLLLSQSDDVERIQGGFISADEVKVLVDYVGTQKGFDAPYYLPLV